MTTQTMEDLMVEFDLEGKSYSASADAEVKVAVEDVGPVGYREHCYCDCIQDAIFSKLEIWLDGQKLENPEKELVEEAERRLMRETEYQFERSR